MQKEFIKKTLDLEEYSDTRAAELSGGNKRKLVCAMSLVGCPKVDFLDEPTTGVDPVSRRSLFKMLKSLEDTSIILTTHRMDEAESLCDNIAILINGRFVCYGSPGHLKSVYGQGHTISLHHTQPDSDLLASLSEQCPFLQFEGCLKSDTVDAETRLPILISSFKISNGNSVDQVGGLGHLFKTLCQLKYEQETIVDFTVTRSSLENVFVEFAKYQIEQPTE
jgi:ATP-binding cassette subfamily A (ABC1) protein 3